eukprot:GGOE01036077.1.p2 GENE.GGOE01036077.1~~GGOE01036077.1.p2  ORF type:complete len:225 (+),score=43.19 GGOE01036077.1:657-1331(+)
MAHIKCTLEMRKMVPCGCTVVKPCVPLLRHTAGFGMHNMPKVQTGQCASMIHRCLCQGLWMGSCCLFFTSWQCHACRLMFDAADDTNVWGMAPASGIQHRFADYAYRMVDRLISDGFFEDMTRSPPVTVVAVAAAVEGANDAFAMATALLDEGRAKQYAKCIRTGLQYLLGLQATRPLGRPEKEIGGFGLTPHLRNQRVDFCGPAARAIMKTLTNNIKPLFPAV